MRKIVLTFGLIAGAILSGMMLISMSLVDRIGFDKGEVIGYTTMVLAFLMVFFGVKSYRDNVAGGTIRFGRAFKVGLLITIIACICYVATWQLIYYQLVPDFSDKYAAYAVEKARLSGASEAELATRTQEMASFREMYRNPLVNIAITLLEPLPIGLLATLMTAGVLSRKRQAASATTGLPGWRRCCEPPAAGGGRPSQQHDRYRLVPDPLHTRREPIGGNMQLGAFSISLAVKDIQTSKKFYEKFGFTQTGGDIAQQWLILKNGSTIIGLFQGMFEKNMLTFNPGWDQDAGKLDSFTDVRELQKALKAAGVTLMTEADESTRGPAHFMVVDPDGNPVLVDQHV